MYIAYSRPLLVEYRARVLSLQTTTFFLLYGVALRYLLPLAIVWGTDGFWVKEATFREAPIVAFKRQFYLLLEGTNSSSNHANDPLAFGYSSWPAVNEALKAQNQYIPLTISDFEVAQEDSHHLNQLKLQLKAPLNLHQSRIQKITLLLLFYYQLEERISFKSEVGSSGVHLVGTLQLQQQRPFAYKGFDHRYNGSLISSTGERLILDEDDEEVEEKDSQSSSETRRPLFTLDRLLDAYYARDYFTTLTNTRTRWNSFTPGSLSLDPVDDHLFTISATVHYHPLGGQSFVFETGFWQLLKWATVQYVVVWILVNWALEKLERIVYSEYLVPTICPSYKRSKAKVSRKQQNKTSLLNSSKLLLRKKALQGVHLLLINVQGNVGEDVQSCFNHIPFSSAWASRSAAALNFAASRATYCDSSIFRSSVLLVTTSSNRSSVASFRAANARPCTSTSSSVIASSRAPKRAIDLAISASTNVSSKDAVFSSGLVHLRPLVLPVGDQLGAGGEVHVQRRMRVYGWSEGSQRGGNGRCWNAQYSVANFRLGGAADQQLVADAGDKEDKEKD
ncbi:hypothetical protein TYRP_003601 [Tyrophagus putrescentiae]|nr:hypothetical protein TYRP_003601 [Tyrophagus putrescentiae]